MTFAREQSRLRAVVDTAVDGVILIDANGMILMFNPACEHLFGYASFEVIGRNVKMLMPEPYRGEHDHYLHNYRETGERKIIGVGREVLGRRRSGTTFPMDLSVGESEEQGEPIFVGIIRDLTERKRAERALREGSERLRAVVETAVDGVILMDENDRILMFNPACETLFGYRADEAIGQHVKMLIPALYREDAAAKNGATGIASMIGAGGEIAGLRKNGETLAIDLSVGQAEQEGAPIFVGIIHDLTTRKRTEEQLVQAQKMETVGQLSGGIAHDFNNLLTVILGNAEALSSRLKAREDLRQLAEAIVGAAERGAELTQRLLAFSRRQVLQPSAVNCNVLVENMQALLRRMLREDIDLRVGVASTPIFALADPAQLENAVLNLSLNAQDAMPNGGALTLTTEEVELDAHTLGPNIHVKPGKYVCVCVADDGAGMSRETLEHVFEPFFTTKEVGKGSGLGLSMVYGFARQSNGHVGIYSELGLGTSVRLYLPLAEGDHSAQALGRREEPKSAARGAELILIVEDDPYVRSHAISSLEALGYRVMVASDGREALNMLNAGARPNLLFTDIVMPGGVSGMELASKARAMTPDLRVLFTSGYPQESLTRGGRLDMGEAMLSKPYRFAELAQRVRDTLDAPAKNAN